MSGIDPRKIQKELPEIRMEIKNLKSRIHSLEDRLDTYSEFVKIPTEPVVEEITAKPVAKGQEKKIYFEEETEQRLEEEKVPVFEEKKMGFEENIGKKWFSRIGIIFIFIGIIFFFKYLFDRDLIGPDGKISIGVIAGLILLVAGEISNKKKYETKYEYLSRALIGGGFAVLYLSVYAAHILYSLIPVEFDLILLALIAILAVFFSLRYSSMVIASEAFFLGYVTSFISSITEYTLVYVTMLTIGLAIIVQRKGWIKIGIGGLIAVYVIHSSWLLGHNSTGYFITNVSFLSIYFIIFSSLAHTIIKKVIEEKASLKDFQSIFHETPDSYQSILMTAMNALFYYLILYLIIIKNYETFTGLFTVIVALVYFGLSLIALNRNVKGLFSVHLTLCVFFITLAIPLQLNYEWVTIAWAIEGLILLVIGSRYSSPGIRVFSNIVGGLTIVKVLLIDTRLSPFNIYDLLESARFFAFLIPIITFYASSIIYFKNKDKTKYESKFWEYYLAGGVLLTTLILMLELKGEWVTIAWAIEGFILLLIGFRYNERIRVFGNIVAGITIVKVLFIDTRLNPFNIYDLLESERFFAFLIPIITFYASSIIYFKNKDKTKYESKFWEYYLVGGVLLTTLILMLELRGALISVAWAIQAIAILIAGFRYGLSFIRKIGIGLFLLTIVKVFIFDLAGLETIYRIISFLILGILLLFVSFGYSKYKDKLLLDLEKT
jgi:uncharacterized membrane protein